MKNNTINDAKNPTGTDTSVMNDKNITLPLASDRKYFHKHFHTINMMQTECFSIFLIIFFKIIW